MATFKLLLTEDEWAKALNADDGAMFVREYLFQQQPQLVERIAAAKSAAPKAEKKPAVATKAAPAKAEQPPADQPSPAAPVQPGK